MRFSRIFKEKFAERDAALIEDIYQRYFSNLIDSDVKVGYTSTRVLGKAYAGLNTILLRRISPHTIAHELMHLAQYNKRNRIPIGERSCDVYTCALGEDVCDTVTYLRVRGVAPSIIHEVCKEAIAKRNQGLRNYISWAENQFEIRMKSKN